MMVKLTFAACAALTLAACAGVPQSTEPTRQLTDKERFVQAIEANGCLINTSTIGPILAQASINQEQLAVLTVALENEGALAPDGTDTVRLSSNNCI